jgi:Rrf2 family protein
MLYSKTCEYAIRAMIYMAGKPKGAYCTAQEVAKAEGLPAYFLSKILRILARHRLLDSAKGPTGGFALSRASDKVFLREIVDAVDGKDAYESCAIGFMSCTEDTPCPLHDMWTCLRDQIKDYLNITSLAQLAETLHHKRLALLDKHSIPRA